MPVLVTRYTRAHQTIPRVDSLRTPSFLNHTFGSLGLRAHCHNNVLAHMPSTAGDTNRLWIQTLPLWRGRGLPSPDWDNNLTRGLYRVSRLAMACVWDASRCSVQRSVDQKRLWPRRRSFCMYHRRPCFSTSGFSACVQPFCVYWGGALSNGIRRRDVQHVCTVVETGGECGVGVNVGDIFSTVPVFSFF